MKEVFVYALPLELIPEEAETREDLPPKPNRPIYPYVRTMGEDSVKALLSEFEEGLSNDDWEVTQLLPALSLDAECWTMAVSLLKERLKEFDVVGGAVFIRSADRASIRRQVSDWYQNYCFQLRPVKIAKFYNAPTNTKAQDTPVVEEYSDNWQTIHAVEEEE